jgi:putative heme-binding domain-containing protein
MENLWSQPSRSTVLLRLALRLNYRPAHDLALSQVADPGVPESDRLMLIGLIGQVAGTECVPVFLKLLDAGESSKVRKETIVALQRFNEPAVAAAVLAAYPKMNADLRAAARNLLCSRPAWAELLLAEVDAGRIDPKEVVPADLQQLALHNQPNLTKLMEKHWGKMGRATPDEKRAAIHGIKVSLKLAQGNPVDGKVLFTKTCATCHQLYGEGNKVGPDLTGTDRKNLDYLLTSIVDPSAAIRKEFFMYTAILSDGRTLNGLLVESTPNSVTLLDAKNQRTVVSQQDIDQIEPAQLSLMPEKLLEPLTAQQVRDLMSYLQSAAPVPAPAGQ